MRGELNKMSDVIKEKYKIQEKILEMLNDSEYCYRAVLIALKDVAEIIEGRNRYTKMCVFPRIKLFIRQPFHRLANFFLLLLPNRTQFSLFLSV